MTWTRREFLAGAAIGAAAGAGATALPRILLSDPARPPDLYEYSVDSYWFDSSGLRDEALRPPLRGDAKADVAIVGGGFTGLATAIAIARRQPERRVVVLEGARCGYGASGRNGGFVDVTYSGMPFFFDAHGPELSRAVYDVIALGKRAIDRLQSEDGVACDLESNGGIHLASSEAQFANLEARRDARLRWASKRESSRARSCARSSAPNASRRGSSRPTPGS